MGIKKLNSLLTEVCPDIFKKVSLTEFKGCRIGIDANQFAMTMISRAHARIVDSTDVAMTDPDIEEINKFWYKIILDIICTFLTHSITPVFIFDGSYPLDKVATQGKRREEREIKQSRLNELKARIRSTDILERSVPMINELRKHMRNSPPRPNMELLQGLLVGIGIPMIQAKYEAEQLCSKLCIEGKVSAVFSTDTDTLVHGAPRVITGFAEEVDFIPQVKLIALSDVLTGLSLSYEQFIDLGIMAGCDYNTNMKMIGIKKSYGLIKSYGTIDNLPHDTTCLRHQQCRDLFQYIPSSSLMPSDKGTMNVSMETLSQYGRDILNQYDLINYMPRLVDLYKNLHHPSSHYISCPPGKVELKLV